MPFIPLLLSVCIQAHVDTIDPVAVHYYHYHHGGNHGDEECAEGFSVAVSEEPGGGVPATEALESWSCCQGACVGGIG